MSASTLIDNELYLKKLEQDCLRDLAANNTAAPPERHKLLHELYFLIDDWEGKLPNLRDVFRTEEIDWLLAEDMKNTEHPDLKIPIIDFVVKSGYQDEAVLDADGKPILCRPTAVHHGTEQKYKYYNRDKHVRQLFKIYKCEVNYVNESGLTHFHVACEAGCVDVVKQFLELGQDPNVIVEKTGDSPLHVALNYRGYCSEMVELLLQSGANPNLANKDGSTILHVASGTNSNNYVVKMVFELTSEDHLPVQLDAQDKSGRTPLHLATAQHSGYTKEITKFLLRNGANPNLSDQNGLTALHMICKRDNDDNMVEYLFEICEEIDQSVEIDVVDKLGRTPLQFAVANLLPGVVKFLLDNDADPYEFVFPTDDYFAEGIDLHHFLTMMKYKLRYRLRLAAGALGVVEQLEEYGYELERSGALTIMKFFDKYGLFEKPADRGDRLDENACFEMEAQDLEVTEDLSLYDVTRLRPEDAEDLLTYSDFFELASLNDYVGYTSSYSKACTARLCEIMARGFFRRWAFDPFMELTGYRLPILCSEKIIKLFTNEDLCHICLAAAGQKCTEIRDAIFFRYDADSDSDDSWF
ncbi:unnamed protein product [Trichogramma brassicae]|uniref:Uncharacterized protein n=1 Tax=Trichogramma brassicae TaxID=86971 RepID=A0A6H5HXN7_9HYME|nr:unnamed protein product [Trichogramma brassicae]